jgi:succinate dehydrogenase/fumarate reductase flavoprotein subunit
MQQLLVNPANKAKLDIILVGTGLAGAAAASSLGELGYNVKAFCFQDSPRRAHSVAAQGGSMPPKITKMTATAFTAYFMM